MINFNSSKQLNKFLIGFNNDELSALSSILYNKIKEYNSVHHDLMECLNQFKKVKYYIEYGVPFDLKKVEKVLNGELDKYED